MLLSNTSDCAVQLEYLCLEVAYTIFVRVDAVGQRDAFSFVGLDAIQELYFVPELCRIESSSTMGDEMKWAKKSAGEGRG